MECLPPEIVSHILSTFSLVDLCASRLVCRAFQQAVKRLAPVERAPELLLSSNYEEIVDIHNYLPSIDNCINRVAFVGKMDDDVWRSPLVQHLLRIDQLDALPWKEFLFNRVSKPRGRNQQVEERSVNTDVVTAETLGDLADSNSTSNTKELLTNKKPSSNTKGGKGEPSQNSIILPTPFRPDQPETMQIQTFNLFDWYNYIMTFVPSNEDWTTTLEEAKEWGDNPLYKTLLELEAWLSKLAAESGLPSWQTRRRAFQPQNFRHVPGLYFGDWQIYHVQMANYFVVLFLFYED